MRLADISIRKIKPGDKPKKYSDGHGLYLLVLPSGGRLWRFDYRFGGKRKTLSMGIYSAVTLADARQRHGVAQRQLAAGQDPSVVRQTEKRTLRDSVANTFEAVARKWLEQKKAVFAQRTHAKATQVFETLLFPWIGNRPINAIDASELLEVLRRIEERGAIHTAHRAKQRCSQVFLYAMANRLASHDPAADLKGALASVKAKHRAAIVEPTAIGGLLRAIGAFEGSLPVRCALRLAPLVFVRPGELRTAEWAEIDLDAAEWRIPAEKMKARQPHLVPLSRQAVAILKELKPLTGSGRFLFPSVRTRSRPMSENTINAALRRLGYESAEMCGHGFRAMASTRLNEMEWSQDAIELQLAHAPRNAVRAAYNRAQRLDERRRMMQFWADHLDELRLRTKVVDISRAV